jgi:hypothetical protein
MQSLPLEKQDWQKMLDHISKAQGAQRITIEIIREDLGAQREVENEKFDGVSYDPKGNTVAVQAGELEHLIQDPAGIEIAHTGAEIVCLEVIGQDGTRHLIYFLPSLHLPDILHSNG